VLAETEIGSKIGKYTAQNRPGCAKSALKALFPKPLNPAQTAGSVHLPFQIEFFFFCKNSGISISHPFTVSLLSYAEINHSNRLGGVCNSY
jgi:hypothetical protein